jgi:ammonia channel protein AmtB
LCFFPSPIFCKRHPPQLRAKSTPITDFGFNPGSAGAADGIAANVFACGDVHPLATIPFAFLVKALLVGLRVSPEKAQAGLDTSEHGEET